MVYSDSAEDYRPVMNVRGHPVSLSILLIIIHTTAMVLFALSLATNHAGLFEPLIFSSSDVLDHGQIWRLFTYPLVAAPSLGFALQMLMLYWFGPEVERFVGTAAFLKLYAALVVLPALVFTGVGFHHALFFQGASDLLFGFFIAFATIYPNVEFFSLRITAKWIAWIFLGIYSLCYLAEHMISNLSMLWICSGIGYLSMRLAGVGGGFGWLEDWRQKQEENRRSRKIKSRTNKEKQWNDSIDPILEKISQHGIGSLTATEKAALENARSALLKRDQRK